VLEGLTVAPVAGSPGEIAPQVKVGPGSALTANGDLVHLDDEVVLVLADVAPDEATPGAGGLFRDCQRPTGSGTVYGDGVYLLVVAPASGFRERAPASGLEENGTVTGCGSRYEVEGVSFRLVKWTPTASEGQPDDLADLLAPPVTASQSLLRNRVAHRFLGTEARADLAAYPFSASEGSPVFADYGPMVELKAAGLVGACDVPLAVLYWPEDSLVFIDRWSVVRHPVPPALSPTWGAFTGRRLVAEGRARFLQFQRQIDEATPLSAAPAQIRALDAFRFLPPVGLLPVHDGQGGMQRGVDLTRFFDGVLPYYGGYEPPISGELAPWLVEQSLLLPAIDLERGDPVLVLKPTAAEQSSRYRIFASPQAASCLTWGYYAYG
jgi:hypothetical protein